MSIDIKTLKKAIVEKGHSWQAEENPITKMDPVKRKNMLGAVKPAGEEAIAPAVKAKAAAASLPTSIDWRNNNGNYVTPVKNQGGCGSCVGFGSTAVFESMVAIEQSKQLFNLSVADSFFCSNHGASCDGWWPSSYFTANQTRGVIPETLFPYASAFPGGNIWPAPGTGPSCVNVPNRQANAFTYGTIGSANSIDTTKAYLVSTGPIAACFDVYQDFYNYTSGIYKHTTGSYEGGHCICIVGYNDNNGDGYWICKNSWDTTWGMSGYFNIAYNQCNIDVNYKYGVTGTVLPSVSKTSLYLTTHGSDGIWTYTAFSAAIPLQIPSTAGLGFMGVISIGSTLYMTTQGSDGIWTFDTASQSKPSQIPSTAGLGFTGIIAIGNTIYTTTHGSDGIWAFDLATQAKPTQIPSTAGLGFNGVMAVGNTLYLTTQGSDGIWTFDLATQAKPTQIPSTAGLGFDGIVAVGSILYTTTHGSDGIWAFDTVSMQKPVQMPSTAGYGFVGIIANGNMLLMTTQGSDGIWEYGIGSTTVPAQMPSTAGLGFTGIIPS